MRIIAHRGNLHGPNPELENRDDYVMKAIDAGFEVEIDVWYVDDRFWLGHDEPRYEVGHEFIRHRCLWCHAKTVETFDALLEYRYRAVTCFFHQNDDVTLTSNGFLWTYPGKPLTKLSICVLPGEDLSPLTSVEVAGVCTDYPAAIRDALVVLSNYEPGSQAR